MNKITKYFRGVNEEAKRIRWPDQKTLWKAVAVVLVISIVTALFIALSDWLAMQIMRAFRIAFPQKATSSSTSGTTAAVLNWIKGVL